MRTSTNRKKYVKKKKKRAKQLKNTVYLLVAGGGLVLKLYFKCKRQEKKYNPDGVCLSYP